MPPPPADPDAADDAYLAQHGILPLINDMVLALARPPPLGVLAGRGKPSKVKSPLDVHFMYKFINSLKIIKCTLIA